MKNNSGQASYVRPFIQSKQLVGPLYNIKRLFYASYFCVI